MGWTDGLDRWVGQMVVAKVQNRTMRFATLDAALYLVTDDTMSSRRGVLVDTDAAAAYNDWAATCAAAAALDPSKAVPLDDARLGSPSPAPRQVFGIGLNYRGHADETGAAYPAAPNVFTKWVSCLTGPFGNIELPSDTVDWECELAVVIGRTARHVAEADAWNNVAGLCVSQDISERTVQRTAPANQFSCGKSFPTFGPLGPVLVTIDELKAQGHNPDDLALFCMIDGEVVQDSHTGDMIFSVPQIIEYLSRVVTLLPGDVIFTGTPSGVGMARTPQRWLVAGQELVTQIEGLGQMRHRCVDAAVKFR
jgi:2,4-didehydro-3-deoxy-L-rhamnonate hydrolase